MLSARYMDRRLLRIIEDSPVHLPKAHSAAMCRRVCVGNLSSHTDYFVNEQETPYTFNAAAPNDGAPADCVTNYNAGIGAPFLNSVGQVAGPGGACGANTVTAGDPTPDGKPDGCIQPSSPLSGD